ncbi:MAG: aminodeoxychorismate/anthranilate synthase component II [Nitrosopumilaceae archaeon]|nr:aminodeoxychorismate/anthranilate synthase component II [Nitrosopumilaceae archaeon]
MTRLLVIDNYDSFVYNIAQYMGELGAECTVVRNDKTSVSDIARGAYDAIVISPGPGTPEDARYFGICADVIRELGPTTPILGVCLGHQGIIHAFGGAVVNAGCARHGKTSPVVHSGSGVFAGVPTPFRATRYHSLVGDRTVVPDALEVTARAEDDGEIMGVRHKRYPIEGVQFHPESIMTEHGKAILANFLGMARGAGRREEREREREEKT